MSLRAVRLRSESFRAMMSSPVLRLLGPPGIEPGSYGSKPHTLSIELRARADDSTILGPAWAACLERVLMRGLAGSWPLPNGRGPSILCAMRLWLLVLPLLAASARAADLGSLIDEAKRAGE